MSFMINPSISYSIDKEHIVGSLRSSNNASTCDGVYFDDAFFLKNVF